MFRLTICFGTLLLLSSVNSMGINLVEEEPVDSNNDLATDEADERLIILPAIALNFNASVLAANIIPILAIATSGAALLTSVVLATILFSLFAKLKYGDGYYGGGSGSYSTYGTGSTGSYRSASDHSAIDWESFSLLNLIKVGQDTWDNYEPTNLECQQRLICEIHRNTELFGYAAEKVVHYFSYLTYANVFNLPMEVEDLIKSYSDAADYGQTSDEDCGDIYNGCKYSITKIAKEFSPNKII